MKLSEFEYRYPEEQIAQYPTENRDEARLMVLHKKTGEIEHKVFTDLPSYFGEGDLMVVNNTKVFSGEAARQQGADECADRGISIARA